MIIEPQNSLIDVMKIPRNKESTQLGGRIENSNNKKKEKAVEEVAFHWTGFVFQYFLFCFGFFFGFFSRKSGRRIPVVDRGGNGNDGNKFERPKKKIQSIRGQRKEKKNGPTYTERERERERENQIKRDRRNKGTHCFGSIDQEPVSPSIRPISSNSGGN